MKSISKSVAYFGLLAMMYCAGQIASDFLVVTDLAKPLECTIPSVKLDVSDTIKSVESQQCNLKVAIDSEYSSYPVGDTIIKNYIAQVIRHNNQVQANEPFAHVKELRIYPYDSKKFNVDLMGRFKQSVVDIRLSYQPEVLTHELNHAIYYGSVTREFMDGKFYSRFGSYMGKHDEIKTVKDNITAVSVYGYSGFVGNPFTQYDEFWAYNSELLHGIKNESQTSVDNLSKLSAYADEYIRQGFYSSKEIKDFNKLSYTVYQSLGFCAPELYYSNLNKCSKSIDDKVQQLESIHTLLVKADTTQGLQNVNSSIICFKVVYILIVVLVFLLLAFSFFLISK
jgi:hypothetical protein